MSREKSLNYLAFAVAALFALARPSVWAAGQGTGRMAVEIRPEALVSAPTTLTAVAQPTGAASGARWIARFELPIDVKIRLARNVMAELSIEPAANLANVFSGNVSGVIQVGSYSVPLAPAVPAIIPIGQSGTHQLSAGITLHGEAGDRSGTQPVRIRLRSLDGAIEWAGTVQLVWNSPAQ